MDQPKVSVVELPKVEGKQGKEVDLGGRHNVEAGMREDDVNGLMRQFKNRAQRVFELSWTGNKIPRGAKIFRKSFRGYAF